MTRYELYVGPRCPSCGGDHFPEDGSPSPELRGRLRYLGSTLLLLLLTAALLIAGRSL